MKRTIKLLIVLGCLAAIAVALGYRIQRYTGPLPLETAAAGSGADGDARSAADVHEVPGYAAPPFERFTEILERPLFAQSRRAVVVEAPPPTMPEPVRLEATLIGVLFSPAGKVALITVRDSSEVVRVAENQLFLGWRLAEIEPDTATFTRGDKKVVLRLKYKPGD